MAGVAEVLTPNVNPKQSVSHTPSPREWSYRGEKCSPLSHTTTRGISLYDMGKMIRCVV